MESRLSRLLVGLSVQISRSDGRVHRATVKSVDAVKSTVMAEWIEKEMHRAKELDLEEFCTLNPELQDHIQSVLNKSLDKAHTLPADKRYEGRLRSSRIPGPAASHTPSVDKTEGRSQVRQTNRFQAQISIPESSSEGALGPIPSEPPTSAALANSGNPNELRRKREAKPSLSVPFVHEVTKENIETVKTAPSKSSGRRKSVAPQELNKSNKRLSHVVKPPEMQTKKGKFKESSRPNQQFYEMVQDFRKTMETIPLSVTNAIEPHRICVCIRKRPMNKQELNRREIDVVSVPGRGALLVHEPKQKVDLTKYLDNQIFQFDYSFDETSTNDLVYRFTAKPLVQSIFEGGMATCFAYGQTGSGKTHTMGGDFSGKQQNCSKGIYALAAQDVFAYLGQKKYANLNLSAYVSFFEIYNGKVYDLLNKKTMLRVLQDEHQQVQVVDLKEVHVPSADEVIKMIQLGSASRTFGQTSANANSSRSHAILQIILRRNDRATTLHGKFSLVDLAGNERGIDVNSNDRATLVETAEINRSLLALKECIRSLGMNSDHIPFRMSTLTKVLRDSFIGEKSRTCMIAMVSPGMASCECTMNTLRYADRVKELNVKSKTSAEAETQEPENCSSDEDTTAATTVYDALSHVADLEENVYVELQSIHQKVKELYESMEEPSFDIEAALPNLIDFSQFSKLREILLSLRTALVEERARLGH
ncbi:kinesin-like protein KIF2C isoform X1 [Hippocampus zosterae]|uniref:kinesin-like protein KIF2C isoform X1 n=1 Tax=Hippocampus zosterae TaxID=109293 RepID=UPI00223D16EE|nr:kinesin-like protein KIF2C isoform X1 [Hippocampus zosterae]XP_051943237.1 kinesin-like protein KIF2C isoform X1 [Hippocampus zosterae]